MPTASRPWTGPGWRAEAESWIAEALRDEGASVTAIDEYRIRFWSAVLTVDTDRGRYWFKQNHTASAREMAVTTLLAAAVPEATLVPVACEASTARILTRDAGPTLHARHGWDLEQVCRLVAVAADLQRRLTGHRRELLAAGVPDLSPCRLPEILERQVQRAAAAPTDHILHLDMHQRARARSRLPQLADRVAVLTESGFAPSLDHNDLHLGNAFRIAGTPRLFDFGDCLLAHPFAVLRVPLHAALRHGHRGRDIDRLLDAFLEPWGSSLPRTDQVAVIDAAVETGGIGRWEVWRRLAEDVPAPEVEQYRQYVAPLLPTVGVPLNSLEQV